jgi:hypothetical protein
VGLLHALFGDINISVMTRCVERLELFEAALITTLVLVLHQAVGNLDNGDQQGYKGTRASQDMDGRILKT